MSGRRLRSSNISSNGEEPTECMVNLSVQQFKHGDIVWSRIDGRSWWPVQVADEKCVACKPKKTTNDQILVRLYGTFEHMYVEPVNCVSKIEKIFGQENSSNREVFQKFLEEDLTRMKSGGQSAATVFESKETAEIEKGEASQGREQRKVKRTMTADSSPLVGSLDNPKAAKQVKVVEDIDTIQASEFEITKRRTRSETFKARNEGTSGIEMSNEAENLNSGASTISSVDKKDFRSMQRNDAKETLTLNLLDNVSESKCVKQDLDVNKNVLIEFSDVKDIKKLVTKIVKEVAEEVRNEALKGKGMERCPENTEDIDRSRKKSSEIKKMKLLIPRRAKNKDIEVHITEGVINDTQGKAAGPRDVGKPNGPDKLSNGASLDKIYNSNERTKDTPIEKRNAAERANNEIQGINGAHRPKGYLKGIDGDENSRSNSTKRDWAMYPSKTKGGQRGMVFKQDVSMEKKESPSTTKCFLSPRCTRIMQSLGLSAPLGSPFCKNGFIRSFLP